MADTTLPGLLQSGVAASRPAASAVGSGALYYSTDTHVIEQSDGSSWSTWADFTALSGTYQPLDSDLTAIAALSTTSYGRSLLTLANVAALYTALSVDVDGTLAANSDTKLASQKAVKTYVDANAGGGDVTGAGSSVLHDLAGFADTSGAVLEDSGVKVDTDTALAADSASRIPTQHAVKTYVDAGLAGGGGGTGFVLADSGGEETVDTVATSGASQTIDAADGNVHDITLTAACTLTLSAVTSGKGNTLTLILRQDGTGGRLVTWPASISWLSGAAPLLQTAANGVDIITLFTVDGGTTWYGFAASNLSLDWKQAISGTSTYASSTTFTCSGDQTSVFKVAKKLRIKQTTLKYFIVTASSYNAGTNTTTVTITGGSDYSLANAALTEVLISELDYPDGWPGWFNFTPSTTGITSESSVCRFAVIGRNVFLALNLTGTSNNGAKAITLPITPANISSIQWITPLTVKDNGTVQTTPGEIVINPNNASASVYKNTAAGGWTASGAWFAIGAGTYEI